MGADHRISVSCEFDSCQPMYFCFPSVPICMLIKSLDNRPMVKLQRIKMGSMKARQ